MEYTPGECILQSFTIRKAALDESVDYQEGLGRYLRRETDNFRKWTYQDDITPQKMSEVCFENYDPAFRDTVIDGDLLVSGYNFGCGSSVCTIRS